MGSRATVLILVLCSARAIRVPTVWSDSAVAKQLTQPTQEVETLSDVEVVSEAPKTPIPVEYFQYPANKPQFAIEVATYHGVKNPEKHFSAYPVRPYTGVEKPVLGKHHILDESNPVFKDFQQYTKINDESGNGNVKPGSSVFEVFHPYKLEEPALQDLYKDPILEKIRNDIYNSQNRLQKYEKEAGKPNIQNGEYLESPEQTDRKKNPQRNIPVPYEVHRPQRRPIYYKPSPYTNRDHYLNQKFRHPWNQQNAKIRPIHYRPLRHHLQRLRQNHATKFDDERNQYPQVPTNEQISEVSDGYDIYERGKAKYVALRNNVDESINNAKKQSHPENFQRLELQNNDDTKNEDEDSEFIPIKNYAQVRKTETTRHLPKSAAYEEADNLDEIKNAPRLREAIKSTKAQTVYTEEGYEDAAYDHEGEEKHAAENEAHGGHLTEKEISGGQYKTPSESQKYQDASGNEYRDQNLHGEQWKDSEKEKEKEAEEEDYSEDETDKSIEAEIYDEVNSGRDKRENESGNSKQISEENDDLDNNESLEKTRERSKREYKPHDTNYTDIFSNNDTNLEHQSIKRESNFKIPEINLSSTFLTNEELLDKSKLVELAKLKSQHKKGTIKEKYPYYFVNLKNISKHSPLRYAENMKFIPKKTDGGTEFYDSRSKILECPEVDDEVDALPEKLKKHGHPDESEEEEGGSKGTDHKNKADFSQIKNNSRLRGLGDKIDCFKAKFFGENPLDSPFFKEEIIANPEPVTAPNIPTYKLLTKEPLSQASTLNNVFNSSANLKENTKENVTNLFNKLRDEQQNLQETLAKSNDEMRKKFESAQNISIFRNPKINHQSNVYSDVLANIKSNFQKPNIQNITKQLLTIGTPQTNVTYISYQNKDYVTKPALTHRKRRSVPFVYEPYKIIKDGQFSESRKTTTTNNISPLIKQLQSSRIIDRVSKSLDQKEQPVKRNVPNRMYKDIGRKERGKNSAPSTNEAELVEVTVDSRRGEPRYEVKVANHKSKYVPVENKKSMTPEDYETRTNKSFHSIYGEIATTIRPHVQTTQRVRQKISTTLRPFFDVSKYLPKPENFQKASASNTVKKVVRKPTTTETPKRNSNDDKSQEDDTDEEYEDYEDEDTKTTTTSTTTTAKPLFRRRKHKTTSTTVRPEDEVQELPKLRLITRFNTTPTPRKRQSTTSTESPTTEKNQPEDESIAPKYREKKKKSSKSTLVTDSKTYGDQDENTMKDEEDEVDSMIGIQQDMEEYKPRYEKEIENGSKKHPPSTGSSEEDENEDDNHNHSNEHSEEFSDEDFDSSEEDSDSSESDESEPESTTPEPTKQTLLITTEVPVSTTEARSAKIQIQPIIHRKKIEIHKEFPVNKSSPHVTQFKQDIKEVEIIKEMPSHPRSNQKVTKIRKPQKNIEALELYKDDKLAEEINKLGAVEVFKQNLDLVTGPKHGGNYRSDQSSVDVKDPEVSQSKNEKLVEIVERVHPIRQNKGRNNNERLRNSGRNAKLEISESGKNTRKLHGGNLKSFDDFNQGHNSKNRNAKLLELDEEQEDSDSREDEMHGGNFKTLDNSRFQGKSLHGGNYRSAKIVQAENDKNRPNTSKEISDVTSDARSKAAVLLNTFVQAAPHLTTTPAYILDPSKRMYYYVDA